MSDITAMSDLLYGLTNSEILTINDETFKDALSYIGALSGFSSSQLESWVQVLKRVCYQHFLLVIMYTMESTEKATQRIK